MTTKKTESEFCTSAASHENWLANTGATAHIIMQDNRMVNLYQLNISVVVGDGTEVTCTKRGDITLRMGEKAFTLKQVLYTPKFHKNIISIGVLIRDGCEILVSSSTMTTTKGQTQVCFNQEPNGVLYYFKGYRNTYAIMVTMSVDYPTENQDISSRDDNSTNSMHA